MVAAAVSLPQRPAELAGEGSHLHSPCRLPRVLRVPRKGPILTTSPFIAGQDILALNLTRGCGHRCAFCSVRANPSYPDDDTVYLFTDTAEGLRKELASRSKLPRAVYLSPGSDPFPPLNAVQLEAVNAVRVLAEFGVGAWIMTRGLVRPSRLRALAAFAPHVRVTVGMTTRDRAIQRILEPLAAPPELRLRQITRLRELGMGVQVLLEPLLPGLTDTRENLEPLLEGLAAVGVRHVSAGYGFLRAGIREQLQRALEPFRLAGTVLGAYEEGPILASGPIVAARYLPKNRRQRGYANLMALAARVGITVSVSGITNPDFASATRPLTESRVRPSTIPLFAGLGTRLSLS